VTHAVLYPLHAQNTRSRRPLPSSPALPPVCAFGVRILLRQAGSPPTKLCSRARRNAIESIRRVNANNAAKSIFKCSKRSHFHFPI